jgi:hypothetical protein
VTSDEALTVARRLATEHGWPFLDPVSVRKYRPLWFEKPRWQVMSNHESRGMNVLIEIDDRTGDILQQGYLPR